NLWITTLSHHLTTRVIHSLSGELRRNLLTILAAAIGGSGVRSAFIAQQHLLAASIFIDAVHESIGAGAALHAVAQLNKARVIHASAKFVVHALVKDVHGAFPQALIAVFFAVAHDTAVDLINILETTVFHQHRQNFAANSTGAVGDNRPVFHPVVFARFDFFNEIMRGFHIGHHGIFKLADFRFHRIAAIEENDLIAMLFDELIDLFGLQVHPAADDPVLVNFQFTRRAEGNDFIANLDGKPREVFGISVGPFEGYFPKAWVFLGFTHVFFARFHVSSHGAVNTVLGDQDASLQTQGFAEVTLPQHDGLWVFDGGKAVVEKNFSDAHAH